MTGIDRQLPVPPRAADPSTGPAPQLIDSRRLTGPSLWTRGVGAIIEISACEADLDTLLPLWKQHLQRLLSALNWPDEGLFVRRHGAGACLGFSAPMDALYAATEINEAAWSSACGALAGAAPIDGRAQATTLRKCIESERQPELLALAAAATDHQLSLLADDEQISLGAGTGVQTWPRKRLPQPDAVNWSQGHDIPVALITGTNGKTTTVRLLAAILTAAGKRCGVTSTDGIQLGGKRIARGDYSGPGGARQLLRNRNVETAVLEVARGGLLRRGLAVTHARAAAVLNVADDHLGEYGIESVQALAEAKFVVAKAIDGHGVLVLNADDRYVRAQAQHLQCRVDWFSLDPACPHVRTHLANGGVAWFIEHDHLLRAHATQRHSVVPIAGLAITLHGAAKHNVANCLAAAALAHALGCADPDIATGLGGFRGDHVDNPGRGNYYDIGGVHVLLDFAHNAHAMQAVLAGAATRDAQRRLLLLSHAGDRSDAEIEAMTRAALRLAPQRVIVSDLPGYERGRGTHEVAGLVERTLRNAGFNRHAIQHAAQPLSAVKMALDWARPDDLLLLFVLSQREEVAQYLQSLST